MEVSLTENTPSRSNWDFLLLWHDSRVDNLTSAPDELDVTALLAGLSEACCLKPGLISRNDSGLCPNLYLDRAHLRGA